MKSSHVQNCKKCEEILSQKHHLGERLKSKLSLFSGVLEREQELFFFGTLEE